MTNKSLVSARWVVPVEPEGAVLEHHSVAWSDGTIEAVLPAAQARARFPSHEELVLENHALIPGLVNAHTHAAMSLMRGLADDLPLMRWLQEHIWPAEQKHVSEAFVRDGTLLACAEMLRGGITCFNDMYLFPGASLETALACGMRSVQGIVVFEFPTAYASDPADYLRKGLALRDRHGEEPLASFTLAPHAPYTVSDDTFRRVAALAAELDLPVHIHLHETEDEVSRSVAEHGVRPLERLGRLGLLGPGLIAVHSVHLSPAEIDALARHGGSAVHCPSSNLKLACGFAPVDALTKKGVNVALGTDGAASNNRLDLFQEMRTAALVAKAVAANAEALPAHAALRMATLAGARAVGLEGRIGSLLPGKAADLVAVDLSAPELGPLFNPVSQLVYAAGREHVSHVWIDGRMQVREGKLVNEGFSRLESVRELWQNALKSRADS